MEKNNFRTRKVNIIIANDETFEQCVSIVKDFIYKYNGLSFCAAGFEGLSPLGVEEKVLQEIFYLPNFVIANNLTKEQKRYFKNNWFYDIIDVGVDSLYKYLQTKLVNN